MSPMGLAFVRFRILVGLWEVPKNLAHWKFLWRFPLLELAVMSPAIALYFSELAVLFCWHLMFKKWSFSK